MKMNMLWCRLQMNLKLRRREKIIELNNVNVPKSGRRNAEMNLAENLKRTQVNLLLVWWITETAVIGDYDYSGNCGSAAMEKLCVNFPLLGVPMKLCGQSINGGGLSFCYNGDVNVINFITIATTLLLLSRCACLNMLC